MKVRDIITKIPKDYKKIECEFNGDVWGVIESENGVTPKEILSYLSQFDLYDEIFLKVINKKICH